MSDLGLTKDQALRLKCLEMAPDTEIAERFFEYVTGATTEARTREIYEAILAVVRDAKIYDGKDLAVFAIEKGVHGVFGELGLVRLDRFGFPCDFEVA